MSQPNGASAVANAHRTTRSQVGMCLWQVQEWWGSGHAWPDAITQWNNTLQHRDRNIPIGAPVFYSGGAHGHVAIYVGGGLVRSTDAPSNGLVADVPLDWPYARWGHAYIGWGGKLAGLSLPITVPSAPRPQIYIGKLRFGQKDSDSVKYLQGRLNAVVHTSLPTTGNYVDLTDAAVRAFQKSIGDAVDPVRRSSIGPKQAARLWAGQAVDLHP